MVSTLSTSFRCLLTFYCGYHGTTPISRSLVELFFICCCQHLCHLHQALPDLTFFKHNTCLRRIYCNSTSRHCQYALFNTLYHCGHRFRVVNPRTNCGILLHRDCRSMRIQQCLDSGNRSNNSWRCVCVAIRRRDSLWLSGA